MLRLRFGSKRGSMKIWAVTLITGANEPLEPRVVQVIRYLMQEHPTAVWRIEDIDALSQEGGALAEQMNNFGEFTLEYSKLINVLNADGQVIELDAVLVSNNQEKHNRIVIRDGSSIDVIGVDHILPESVIGRYTVLDEGLMYL